MQSSNATQLINPTKTSDDLVSLPGFYAITWVAVAVCTLMCTGRVYIRYKCFNRLLIDDWALLFAWTLLIIVASLGQVYIKDIYLLIAVSNGKALPTPSFPIQARDSLRGFGIAILCCYLGIWAIKLNFLLFFRRMGHGIRAYTVCWWIVLSITLACGVVTTGVFQWRCVFGPIEYILLSCSQPSPIRQTYVFFKISCIVDVVSDVLIICFPTVILWKTQVEIQKKFVLSCIFSLASFTIAVTIVRGSIFGGTYKSINKNERKELNVTWIWFWFFIEFAVSMIIACLVSFRVLFTRRVVRQGQLLPPQPQNGLRKTIRRLHDSLLEMFRDTEAIEYPSLPIPASGTFSASFITHLDGDTLSDNEKNQVSVMASV